MVLFSELGVDARYGQGDANDHLILCSQGLRDGPEDQET
jgi:hypothetical protein